MKNQLKYALFSLSAVILLAACGNGDTQESTPVEEPAQTEQEDTQPEDTQSEEQGDTSETDDSTDDTSTQDQEGTSSESPGIENREFGTSLEDAIQIYHDEAGEEEILIEEIEFDDEDDDRYIYEIEGYVDNTEYEIDIDAESGDVLEFEVDDEDDQDETLDLEGIITPQEAMQAAIEESDSAYVTEWELEVEDGRTEYDVDVENGPDRDVDAHSGEIVD